jgi:hypothetical protein
MNIKRLTNGLLLACTLMGCSQGAWGQAMSGSHVQYGLSYNKTLKQYEVSYQTNSLAPFSPPSTSTAQLFILIPDAGNGGSPSTGKYDISSFTITNYDNGTWAKSDYVNGPVENPKMDYFGVTLSSTGTTAIELDAINTPKILFSFKLPEGCIDSLSILETTDPFFFDPFSSNSPNSQSLNINNNFDVVFPSPNGSHQGVTWNPGYESNYTGNLGPCGTPLPVKLLRFEAVRQPEGALLSWETGMEQHSDYFGIERSADGVNWETLGKEMAAGQSDVTHSYTYLDKTPGTGTRYYRIRMADRDGSAAYSPVRTLIWSSSSDGKTMILYPNPATDRVQFQGLTTPKGDVIIYTTDGRVAAQYPGHDLSQGLDVRGLAGGTYQLKITNGTESYVRRLVVVH